MFDERKFRAQLILADVSMRDLADILHVNPSTLYRKIQQDGSFTREEINTMIDVLHIEDPKEIFFAEQLA